jgi:hypothetical protein
MVHHIARLDETENSRSRLSETGRCERVWLRDFEHGLLGSAAARSSIVRHALHVPFVLRSLPTGTRLLPVTASGRRWRYGIARHSFTVAEEVTKPCDLGDAPSTRGSQSRSPPVRSAAATVAACWTAGARRASGRRGPHSHLVAGGMLDTSGLVRRAAICQPVRAGGHVRRTASSARIPTAASTRIDRRPFQGPRDADLSDPYVRVRAVFRLTECTTA